MTESKESAEPERDEQMPDWEKRFRAPRVSLPDWAQDAPDRSLFVSNATGTYELYAWDRASGGQRQVTDRPNGTTDGVLTPDGAWIWWFDDKDGDETPDADDDCPLDPDPNCSEKPEVPLEGGGCDCRTAGAAHGDRSAAALAMVMLGAAVVVGRRRGRGR